jgi:hypothetical protein
VSKNLFIAREYLLKKPGTTSKTFIDMFSAGVVNKSSKGKWSNGSENSRNIAASNHAKVMTTPHRRKKE